MNKDSKYYVDGTDFEVTNCPKYKICKGNCREDKNCVIKSHMVHLSALIAVCESCGQGSTIIGSKCCFDSFHIMKK